MNVQTRCRIFSGDERVELLRGRPPWPEALISRPPSFGALIDTALDAEMERAHRCSVVRNGGVNDDVSALEKECAPRNRGGRRAWRLSRRLSRTAPAQRRKIAGRTL